MAIIWDQERMTTGVPEIDAQHQEWIRRFNDFHDAVVNKKGREAIARTMKFMTEYTHTHFAHEEACMAAHRCSSAAANKAAHDEVRAELAKIEARIAANGIQTLDVVQLEVMLGNWIRSHICTIDVKLRDCVRPAGGGKPG